MLGLALVLSLSPFLQAAADPTLPPPDAAVLTTTEGRGVQVYRCAAQDSTFQWTLVAPEATLFRPGTGTPVGTHSAGPTWTWQDHSSLKGDLVATRPATEKGDIPWLLLQTSATGRTQGMLSGALWVRRSETHGGTAPLSGCDSQHADAMARVPYTATYTFYGRSPVAPVP